MSEENKYVVAAGPRNDVKSANKANELQKTDTASLAASHPIIARHWGIT